MTANPAAPAPVPESPAAHAPADAGADGLPPVRVTAGMHLLRLAGVLLLGVGFVGIFVPLLPTTIFWIIAALCFGRSDPRLQAWVFNHHRFGRGVEDFVVRGVIRRRAKQVAVVSILISFAISAALTREPVTLAIVGAVLAGVILYILTRPSS